jgi:Ca2+-binding RTX toxin-like protein
MRLIETVTINGTVAQGQTLTASHTLADAAGSGVVSYQWLANGREIRGATGANLALSQAEVGKTISVRATYVDGQRTTEAVTSTATAAVQNVNDAPTGTLTITGTVAQGQTLMAENALADADGMGTVSYQWFADGVAIRGATRTSLTLGQAEVGKAISVRAAYTDGQRSAESVLSAATLAVQNLDDDPTGALVISGTAIVGRTLMARSSLADADGLGSLTYRWFADGTEITGATALTYRLTAADVGKAITVRASYVDGQGSAEAVTSAATALVRGTAGAPSGGVAISGTTTQGQLLTASHTLSDPDGMGTVSYQWFADGTAIDGATGATLTLGQAQVGRMLSVRASYVDGKGNAEAVTSSVTSAVRNVNDAPTGVVVITGAAVQGQTLTASHTLTDADGLGAVSYQWFANGAAIAGATGDSLTLGQALVGRAISVRATYVDGQRTTEAVTSTATAAVQNVNDAPTGALTLSGTPTEGQTLTLRSTIADADGMGSLSHQWFADGVVIEGATSSSLVLGQAEVGKIITARASYVDACGTSESVSSAASTVVRNINDAPTGTLTITGTVAQGQTLMAENALADADGMGTVSYQWFADGVAIRGATRTSLTLGQAEVGKAISVRAAYTDGQRSAESVLSAATLAVQNLDDDPTGALVISGTAIVGRTLMARSSLADADGLGSLTYRWFADGTEITGATALTYRLTAADVGKAITVRASYVDGQGSAEAVTSAATALVRGTAGAPSGGVAISGTTTQGQLLTASHTLSDPDGMGTVSYQWFADGTAIDGATGATLTLGQAQVGRMLSVRASYVDGKGNAEAVTSSVTSAVRNVNDAPTGVVVITGAAVQGQTLTASHTLTDADGLGAVSYQWFANGAAIAGATGDSLTLGQALVGRAISVRATYVDGQRTTEAVTSTATAAVQNVNDAPTGALTLSGTPTEGQTLTLRSTIADADGMGSLSHQWFADGVVIEGATSSSLVLGQAEVGKIITARASYVDACGTSESVSSAASTVVRNINDAPTGTLTITGTVAQGQTLMASSTIADEDGLGTVSYQWFANGAAIEGATGTQYTLRTADVGKIMSVRASYVDGLSTAEVMSSAPTSAVVTAPVTPEPVFVETSASPGEAEAIALYLVNQLRHAPQSWASMLAIDVTRDWTGAVALSASDVIRKDSLIYNMVLDETAGKYSNLLTQAGGLDHFLPGMGPSDASGKTYPWTRAASEGYTGSNVTENLAYNMVRTDALGSLTAEHKARTLVEQLFIDDGVAGAGHRINLLMANHSEVGFGFAAGPSGYKGYSNYYTTQNFGTQQGAGNTPYLTGFALRNADGNLQYNSGEGLAGVTITIHDLTEDRHYATQTKTNGYWHFAAKEGHSYSLTASGGDFVGTARVTSVSIDVDGPNGYNSRSVDFFSAVTGGDGLARDALARVDYGVPGNQAPTGSIVILGSPEVGKTLTVDTSKLQDADGLGTLTYKWFVDGREIVDAFGLGSTTSSSLYLGGKQLGPNVVFALEGSAFTLDTGAALVGHRFSVVVLYTDKNGTLEVLRSDETAAVTNMTVAQARASLGDASYKEISVTDTVANLIDLARDLTTLSGSALQPFRKIYDFHPADDAVVSVADAAMLYSAIYKVKGWNDCFSEDFFYKHSPGSVAVADSVENIYMSMFNRVDGQFASTKPALTFLATDIEITGGSATSKQLLDILNANTGGYGSKVAMKPGATLVLTDDLSALSPEARAKIIDFLGDSTAPELVGARVAADSSELVLVFNEGLDSGSVPTVDRFRITVDGQEVAANSVSISGSTVKLLLAAPVALGAVVSVAYDRPATGELRDLSGNDTAALGTTAVEIVDPPPKVLSVRASADGSRILVTFDRHLSAQTASVEDFTVYVADPQDRLSYYDVYGNEGYYMPGIAGLSVTGSVVELTLAQALNRSCADVDLSYRDPTAGDDAFALQGLRGVDVAGFEYYDVDQSGIVANDTVAGTTGDDTLIGTGGNDRIYARQGADLVEGGDGNDLIDAGMYRSLRGSTISEVHNDTVWGGNGDDFIYGGRGDDSLSGDAGSDFVFGYYGSDQVSGGKGADYLLGSYGSDVFVFRSGDSGQAMGFDRILDFTTQATATSSYGADRIEFRGDNGAQVALTIGGTAESATATRAAIDQSTGVASFSDGSGSTLADALGDIAASFTAGGDAAGEFALFRVGGEGDHYLMISDGIAGLTVDDVVVALVDVPSVSEISTANGSLWLLA